MGGWGADYDDELSCFLRFRQNAIFCCLVVMKNRLKYEMVDCHNRGKLQNDLISNKKDWTLLLV
jgi:hypothetical protein